MPTRSPRRRLTPPRRRAAPQPSQRMLRVLGIGEARPAAPIERREQVTRWTLAGADVLCALAALTLVIIGVGGTPSPVLALVPPAIVALAKVLGLYDRDELVLRKSTLDEVPGLFQLATLFALVAWLGDGPLGGRTFTGTAVLALWSGALLGFAVLRALARAVVLRHSPVERCLVVGDGDAIESVAAKLDGVPGVHAHLVARVPVERARESLSDLVREHEVHRVLIAPRASGSDGIVELVALAKSLGVRVSILPRIFEVVGSSVVFDELGGVPVLGVRRFGLSRSSQLAKRALDLTGASALLLCTVPLWVLAALAVRLDSSGSVFFRQVRVGRDGRFFKMFKFRTMVDGAETQKDALREHNETQGLFKIAADPRITRVGRLLRRTSLDELPQLLNVFRGEMSLVGPRPLVIEEDRRVEGWHRRRLHLIPGMTGHWQVLGSARIPLQEMVTIDYLYAANWTLWTDVKILLRTVPYVLARRGL